MNFIKRVMISLGMLVLLAAGAYKMSDKETKLVADLTSADVPGAFIDTETGRTYYELEGAEKAPLAVLVHGFSASSPMWSVTKEALISAGYRVLVMDLYGRGYSDRPDIDYRMEDYVAQIDSLLAALNIKESFYLIGNSMGGAVATHFANQYPQKVKKMVLFAPLIETPARPELAALKVPYLGEYLAKVVMVPKLQNNLSKLVFEPEKYPEWEGVFERQTGYEGFARAMLNSARYLDGKSFVQQYEQLGEKPIPVQVFWGREDETLVFSDSQKVRKALQQNVEFIELENTGHLPHYEKPELVNPKVVTFLRL